MATFYKGPDINYWSTTLDGGINDSVTTISLTSATNLNAPGVLVINRQDANGTDTPNAREVVAFTGISSNDITGVTRGFNNSTARSHSDGAVVEAVFTSQAWNDLRDAIAVALSTDGTNLATSGTASIATLRPVATHGTVMAVSSIASVARGHITNVIGSAATLSETITSQGILASTASITMLQYAAKTGAAVTDSDGATVTMDMDAGNIHTVVLGGNRTIAFSNDNVGQAMLVRLTQDGTGSRTVTWTPAAAPATIYWAGGTAPTLTTTANKTDSFGFVKSTASTYDGYIVGQNI